MDTGSGDYSGELRDGAMGRNELKEDWGIEADPESWDSDWGARNDVVNQQSEGVNTPDIECDAGKQPVSSFDGRGVVDHLVKLKLDAEDSGRNSPVHFGGNFGVCSSFPATSDDEDSEVDMNDEDNDAEEIGGAVDIKKSETSPVCANTPVIAETRKSLRATAPYSSASAVNDQNAESQEVDNESAEKYFLSTSCGAGDDCKSTLISHRALENVAVDCPNDFSCEQSVINTGQSMDPCNHMPTYAEPVNLRLCTSVANPNIEPQAGVLMHLSRLNPDDDTCDLDTVSVVSGQFSDAEDDSDSPE